MAKMKLKTLSGAKKRFKMTAFRQDQAQRVQAPPYPDQEDHQAHPRPAYAQVRRQDQRGYRPQDDALRRLISARGNTRSDNYQSIKEI